MTTEQAIERIRNLMNEYNSGHHSVYYTLGAIECILKMTE